MTYKSKEGFTRNSPKTSKERILCKLACTLNYGVKAKMIKVNNINKPKKLRFKNFVF